MEASLRLSNSKSASSRKQRSCAHAILEAASTSSLNFIMLRSRERRRPGWSKLKCLSAQEQEHQHKYPSPHRCRNNIQFTTFHSFFHASVHPYPAPPVLQVNTIISANVCSRTDLGKTVRCSKPYRSPITPALFDDRIIAQTVLLTLGVSYPRCDDGLVFHRQRSRRRCRHVKDAGSSTI